MSQRTQAIPQAERTLGSAPSGAARSARRRAARPAAGTVRSVARSADGDRTLLPDGTWRRVETIRVRNLFG
ncbi:hypothetical protein [Streptomyces durhamensis]|uniref:hypothetical protein n=1 Tax=Streptomyces durhamensis TaxID=68194 RepID=UPI0004CD39DD|nr:hypothetical protein [Streptomyces durhamensis]